MDETLRFIIGIVIFLSVVVYEMIKVRTNRSASVKD